MTNLFREEAVANQATSVFGNIILDARPLTTILTIVAVLLALCLGLLLSRGTYTRKEHTTGFLIPSTGLVEVPAPRAGVITHIAVGEGQLVKEGTPLFTVTAPRTAQAGFDFNKSRIRSLREEIANINSRIQQEEALGKLQSRDGTHRLIGLRRQLHSVLEQRADSASRLSVMQKGLSGLRKLKETGLLAPSQVDSRSVDVLYAQGDLHELDRKVDQTRGEVAALQYRLLQIPLQMALRREELLAQSLQLKRQLDEAEISRSTVIKSPVPGRVTAVIAFPGMNVVRDHHLMAIIPQDSTLQAELLVPSRAVGFVRTHQLVELRYDAFPYQSFGLYGARIRSISGSMLNPEDQIGPIRLDVPAYRVIADLESQTISAYGNRVPLQPGLTLHADIIRDKRTILEWIFDPLIASATNI